MTALADFRRRFTESDASFLTAFALAAGALAGLSAVAFRGLIRLFHFLVQAPAGDLFASLGISPRLGEAFGPAIGGLLVGGAAVYLVGQSRQTGVSDTIEILSLQRREFRLRDFFSMLFLSSLTIGSGGSAGQEGPMVVLGASAGAIAGRRFRPSPERLRAMAGCGIAGAIAAAFNAPLTGFFFAIEVVLEDWNLRSVAPTVLASVVATATSRAAGYNVPVFRSRPYALAHAWEIGLYALLGLIVGACAVLYQKAFFAAEEFFERRKIPVWLTPAIGGLAVGAIGIALPQVFGNGYETVVQALDGTLPLKILLVLAIAKTVATAVTLGSRGWGGDLAPSLFVGAMLGGGVGLAGREFFASAGEGPYALVGMAAFLSAVIHAPITCILLAFELTDNYRVILPVMAAVILATLLARALGATSIYREKLMRRGVITKPPAEQMEEAMRRRVGDLARPLPDPLPSGASAGAIAAYFARTGAPFAPIVEDGRIAGVLYFDDARELLASPELSGIVVAADLAQRDFARLSADSTVREAVGAFGRTDREALPVAAEGDPQRLGGVVSRRDVLRLFDSAAGQRRA